MAVDILCYSDVPTSIVTLILKGCNCYLKQISQHSSPMLIALHDEISEIVELADNYNPCPDWGYGCFMVGLAIETPLDTGHQIDRVTCIVL